MNRVPFLNRYVSAGSTRGHELVSLILGPKRRLGTLSSTETHGGGTLAGKLTVSGKMLCESGGFGEAFLAKSSIPPGILGCQVALSNNYVHRTQLGEGAAELSAAHSWCLGWGHQPIPNMVTEATCCTPTTSTERRCSVSLWVPCRVGVSGEFPSPTSASWLCSPVPREPMAGCPAH